MVIIGTTHLTETTQSGKFVCPSCGPEMLYSLKRRRQYFALFFVPLIPMQTPEDAEAFVECDRCNKTWEPAVLDAALTFDDRLKRLLVLAGSCKGAMSETQVAVLRAMFAGIVARTLTSEEVRQEVARISRSGQSLESLLASLAAALDERGRSVVMTAVIQVAIADGHQDNAEREFIERCARVLGE